MIVDVGPQRNLQRLDSGYVVAARLEHRVSVGFYRSRQKSIRVRQRQRPSTPMH